MRKGSVVLCLILLFTAGRITHVSGSATLEPSISASVNEGGELQVCVSLDPPATENTVVTVTTSVETATEDLDFTPLDENIMFTMGEIKRCTTTNISIPTDSIVESVETFNIRISSNNVPISPISTIATRVNIGDRSRITIAFTASEYATPNENDAFSEVCATITDGEIDRDVTFSITSVSGGTATPLDDFNIIPAGVMPTRFSPDPDNSNPCIQINLVNDNLVEQDEYFTVQLSGGKEAIDVLTNTAQVTITDDDGATVQLSQTSISVPEGNSGNTTVDMCLVLTGALSGLRRNVVVNITTQDITALASNNDYFPIQNQPLTIPSSSPIGGQVCTPIVIIGDDIRELSELFQVVFTAADDNDVVPAVFRITIADDGDALLICPALNDPQNGQVIVSDVNNIQGANATYSCITGFELIGNSMRICQNTGGSVGVWSGSDPTCQSVDCGSPPEPANSIVQSTTTTFGSSAIYSCESGYELSTGIATFTRQCLETEEWSGETPSCNKVPQEVRCPTLEQRDLAQQIVTASSDDFSVIAVNTKPRVPAGPTEIIDHVCGPGNWTQVVLLNMSNPSHRCPSALIEVTTPAGRGCTRPEANSGGFSSTIYSTLGIQYNHVCGRSIGYQEGTTEAFLINSPIPQTIDTFYVDGLSITHGSPRQHIWSFASGLTELPESGINGCFCGDPSITPGVPPPPFVGNNYFCESGNSGLPVNGLFAEDPLWDGMDCPINNCCEFNNPPWFNAELPAPTTDDIEVRLCCSQDTADENVVLQLLELYVSNQEVP